MGIVDLRGVPVEVHERGAGPHVVYVHGEDALLFAAPVLHGLAAHAHVHAPVLPGWGDLPRPPHCTGIDDLAIVVLDLVRAIGEPCVLVGASLGGWVVAEALVRDTSLVQAAVLVAPVGIKVGGRAERDFVDLFAVSDADATASVYAGAPLVDRSCLNDAEVLELARAQESVARYAWKPYLHDPKLRGRLSRVRVPVRVLYGTEDRFVREAGAYYAAYAEAFSPAARLVAVRRAGHRVEEERPDAVVDEVARVLAEVAS